MGHCEETETFLALAINYKTFVEHININNNIFYKEIIYKKLFIEDSNDNLANEFTEDINAEIDFIQYVQKRQLELNDIIRIFSKHLEKYEDEMLCIAISEPLCSLSRWGYNREGYNTSFSNLNKQDFEECMSIGENYVKQFPKLDLQLVWFTKLYSG
tara:strand:- start:1275 stop:1745 length:471 start_codon:yes stop_codon:yes gene_type:complete